MMIQQCSFQHDDLLWNLRLFCISENAHHLACQITYMKKIGKYLELYEPAMR
jgi:hypothetical protein